MDNFLFKLPDVGEGSAEAEIAAWHVSIGDFINEDQPLVDLLTDKATVEISSPVSGIVAVIHAAVGAKAAVGSVLVEVRPAAAGSIPRPVDVFQASAGLQAEVRKALDVSPGSAAPPQPNISSGLDVSGPAIIRERPMASPAVRRRARELGLSLKRVAGSGPAGRVLQQDVDAYAARMQDAALPPAAQDVAVSTVAAASYGLTPGTGSPLPADMGVEEVPIIGLRRRIAERMVQSKRNIPHFGYIEEVDVTELESLRLQLSARGDGHPLKLTPLPFIMRAVAMTVAAFPDINATYDDERGVLRRHRSVDMGIATRTASGLVVPVVRHVQSRSLWDCAREVARLSEAARGGKATRTELSGSTITVTSLGPLGGIAATPVINYPEVAIVGPNRISERPAVRNGQIVVRKVMNISSSFDHRIVDGHEAAAFIQQVKVLLEQPALLFMPTTDSRAAPGSGRTIA